jgi:Protein of unknown function (DUF2950)
VNTFPRPGARRPATLLLLMLAATVLPALAEDATQKTFPTAHEAVAALVAASRANDVAALDQILGATATTLISSGDDTQDKNDRAQFVALYDAHHRLQRTAPGTLSLLVGKNDWPLPIPLVKRDGQWRFDGAAGVQELLYRRIGANELAAIRVARALHQAQLDYAASAHDGNAKGIYAQRVRSHPNTQDGLYWQVAEGEPVSPAGPLVADAEAEGYEGGKHEPFHGYYFRILKSQGPHAHGGAKDYVVDGKMSGGFAILAYPVEFGASGVMSFMVARNGTVFQKDLGDGTAELAKAMTAFDPDPSWRVLK